MPQASHATARQPAAPAKSASRAHGGEAARRSRPGNQIMQHLLRTAAVQPKLTVNVPNDAFEREADRVADQVMRMPDPLGANPTRIQRSCANCRKGLEQSRIQRLCSKCEEELHRKPSEPLSSPEIPSSVQAQINGLRSGGEPLPETVRTFFEPRFGRDFGDVRIHSGPSAARAAQSISARAYTLGRDMVFGSGQYQPDSIEGKRLLAHELTHVVQQGAAGSTRLQRQAILSEAPAGLNARCRLIADAPAASSGLDFLFAEGDSTFTPTAAETASLANFINRWHLAGSFEDILVQGFASNDGDQGFNWTLSCQRAEALRDALTARGISAARITTQAHGRSTAATTPAGNRRAVVSVIPRPAPRPSSVVTEAATAQSCPQSVTIDLSRGNDDPGECQYADARILATIVLDPCACSAGLRIPITIRFHATLDGKSFSDSAGTLPETQASRIGRRFFLQEEGTPNRSPGLVHSGDIGRPGDPDDTLQAQLSLRQTIDCSGGSVGGRVLVTDGGFVQQVLTWSASADRTRVQAADISVEQRQVPGRVLPPLRSSATPYPRFPGVPRDNRCTCHPVTGEHMGATCPFAGAGASFGNP